MFCSFCGSTLKREDQVCQKCGRTVSSASPAAYAAQAGGLAIGPTGTPYAGVWLRFVASLIDQLVLGIPVGGIFVFCFLVFGGAAWLQAHSIVFGDPQQSPELIISMFSKMFGYIALFSLMLIMIDWIYYALMESSTWQATLGKKALNLRVTDMQGNRLSFGHATGRFFAKVLDRFIPFAIGFIMAGFTEKKQALHDMIAATLVIRNN